ncbi:MAG TPA: hypothetical protein VGL78_12460 [Solirubrobacteraceae bacterium]
MRFPQPPPPPVFEFLRLGATRFRYLLALNVTNLLSYGELGHHRSPAS